VEITANRAGTNGGANEHATKTITVTVTDLDDEAPTDIQINDAVFIDGLITLSAFSGVETSAVVMANLGVALVTVI
jgi:hypothetical protein